MLKARVIDNSEFASTGKIRVRIEKFASSYLMQDLSKKPETILEGMKYIEENGEKTLTHEDTDVSIFTPIGGGFDYGIFYLPQVNSVGLVAELGEGIDTTNEYVWMGAIVEKGKTGINIPSTGLNTVQGIDSAGNINTSELNGGLVIKTKSTNLMDPLNPMDSKDTMDWTKREVENLIVINKNNINIYHNTLDDNEIIDTTSLELNSSGVSMSFFDTNNNRSDFTLDNECGFKIKATDDKSERSIESTSSETQILFKNGDKSSTIIQTESAIDVNSNGNHIALNRDSVVVEGNDIYVSAKGTLNLGTEGRRVLLSPDNADSIEIGNVTLTASKKIYG